MFKIGEFSRLTRLSVRMLRYYDEVGLLRAAHTDPYSGYRRYDAGQILTANRIVLLRDAGFAVAEIVEALAMEDEAGLIGLLEAKGRALRAETRRQLERIDRAREALTNAPPPPELTITAVDSVHVLSLRRVIPDYYAEGLLWKEMHAHVASTGAELEGDGNFAIYHDPEYREKDVDVELCVPLTGEAEKGMALSPGALPPGFAVRDTEAVAHMARGMVHGPFENIGGAFLALAAFLNRQPQYAMGDSSRQRVHRGPWNTERPEDYLTEIQIPLVVRQG